MMMTHLVDFEEPPPLDELTGLRLYGRAGEGAVKIPHHAQRRQVCPGMRG
jgi:hypothetical protein